MIQNNIKIFPRNAYIMENIPGIINFWFEFDEMSNPGFVRLTNEGKVEREDDGRPKRRIQPEVYTELETTILSREHAIDTLFSRNYSRISRSLNFDSFKEQVENQNYKTEIKSLSGRQLQIIHRHFPQYNEMFRDAFEYFGQGALFDIEHDMERAALDRSGNLVKYRIHMADGSGIYGRWHSFIRAAIIYNENVTDWTTIDKALAAAYMIHYKVNPAQSFQFVGGDSPENIPENQKPSWRHDNLGFLQNCRDRVSNASIEMLDAILGQSFTFSSPM